MKKSEKKKGRKKKRRASNAARHNLKNMLRFLPLIAPLTITAFIYMWQHTRINIVGLPLETLRAKKVELVKQNDSFRLRIEQLQAPARIESIAREKLGMISPQKYQLVALDEPMQPPEGTVAESRRAEPRAPTMRQSAGLFEFLKIGFLKKRGKFGSASRETASSEAARKSG